MVNVSLHTNYCLVEPQGPLSKEDFDLIAEKIDPVIKDHGKMDGILIKTKEFPGWEDFGDIVAHFRFVKDHHKRIKKVALVTDASMADYVPSLVKHFVNAEVRHFEFQKFQEAVGWMTEEEKNRA